MHDEAQQHLVAFFRTLNHHRIRYCHWKSNVHVNRAVAGLTDLDLLVDRRQATRFQEIMTEFGFKLMRSPAYKQYPAMCDYLGLDPDAGRLSHLHLHYRLILGEQHVKGYRLPVEDSLLTSVRPHELTGVMIPQPEWELAVLIVRILLKTRRRDVVQSLFGLRPLISERMRSELEFLLGSVTAQDLQTAVASFCSSDLSQVIERFFDAWTTDRLTPFHLLQLRFQLKRTLAPYRWESRRPMAELSDLVRSLKYRLLRQGEPRKQMATGGVTIAFVGADGAGKSTVVAQIESWLSWKLDVCTFYMGSKKPSFRSKVAQLLVTLSRGSRGVLVTLFGKTSGVGGLATSACELSEGILSLALGADRYRRYCFGRRAADRGAVVLFDRFPLPETYHVMDGPRSVQSMTGIGRFLARMEHQLYDAIKRPDHIIVMHVSPEVSLARKPNHALAMVLAKGATLKMLEKDVNPDVTQIDANAPLEQVLLQIKHAIWELL